jgi:hypothetical protein
LASSTSPEEAAALAPVHDHFQRAEDALGAVHDAVPQVKRLHRPVTTMRSPHSLRRAVLSAGLPTPFFDADHHRQVGQAVDQAVVEHHAGGRRLVEHDRQRAVVVQVFV